MADLLFSMNNDEMGNPEGIGLSIWRFNIGAGSTGQGEQSDIADPWRRAECFLNDNLQYDWSKQAGQNWFLKAAQKRGVKTFIAFLNSPPIIFSRNGKAYSSSPDSYNLLPDQYGKHVGFMVDVLTHFNQEEGIEFDYISPFNEPQWDWMDPTQEGSPATNTEIATIVRLLNNELNETNSQTKIEIPETAKIDYLFETSDKPKRGSQIREFFDPNSDNYVGNLSHVAYKVAGHSYFSTWDFDHGKNVRKKLNSEIQEIDPSLEYWMTEYCLLEDNDLIKGSGRDLGMTPALYMARVIHSDLTMANASSWQWWIAISPYDYKDGLIYTDKNEQNGNFYDSKLLWVLGNYSRFVRPGMIRVEVEADENVSGDIDFSAYKTKDKKQVVLVVSNYKPVDYEFKLSVRTDDEYSYSCFRTSGSENLSKIIENGSLQEKLKAKGNSVTTFVLRAN